MGCCQSNRPSSYNDDANIHSWRHGNDSHVYHCVVLENTGDEGGKRCCTGTWVFIIHGRGGAPDFIAQRAGTTWGGKRLWMPLGYGLRATTTSQCLTHRSTPIVDESARTFVSGIRSALARCKHHVVVVVESGVRVNDCTVFLPSCLSFSGFCK